MSLFIILAVTFLIQFIVGFEASFVNPIIPFLSEYFNIKESSVIYLNIGFSLIGLLSPIFGMIADKYGKKKTIIFAILFFLSGTILTGWSPSPFIFALGRTIIGIGNITLTATLLSYLSDYVPYNKRGKASGVLRIAFAISILLSPLYSSYVVNFLNLQFLYWSVSVATIVILFVAFKLPEDNGEEHHDSQNLNTKEILEIIKHPITIKFLFAQFLLVISPIVTFSYLSIWLKNTFYLSQENIGYVFTLTAIGTVLGVSLSTALSDRIGKILFTKIMFIIMTISLAPLPYIKSIFLAIVLATLYAVGLDGGWSSFQTICSEIYPRRRTVFMTLLYFVNSICSLFFTIVGPSLFNFGGYKLVITIGTIASVFLLVMLFHIFGKEEIHQKLNTQ